MIDTIYSDPNFLEHHGVKGMRWGVRHGPVTEAGYRYLKKKHYNRNNYNLDLPQTSKEAEDAGWQRLSDKMSALHQHVTNDNVKNSKWIDPSGKREVVFTGEGINERITNALDDVGTYNFFNPTNNPLGHAIFDVVPYYLWGNDPHEESNFISRIDDSIDSIFDKPLTKVKVPIADIGHKWAKSHRI